MSTAGGGERGGGLKCPPPILSTPSTASKVKVTARDRSRERETERERKRKALTDRVKETKLRTEIRTKAKG